MDRSKLNTEKKGLCRNLILLVEDDLDLLHTVTELLEQEGYQVHSVRTKAEAMTRIRTWLETEQAGAGYQLIILDIGLPDGSGYDICKRIRQESTIPILFLTAFDDEESIVKGLDLGADDYIMKPFRRQEFLSRLRAHLRRQIINQNVRMLVSGDLTLYQEEHKVYKNAQEIVLRPVEYALLACFIENPQIILKRDYLLERIWDDNENFVDDATLTVQLSRLRGRLGKWNGNDYISTIRGYGYRWNHTVELK